MMKFLKYLLLVAVGLVSIDLLVRFLFVFTFSHVPPNAELRQRYKYEFENDSTEILIIGASRAMFCYQPSIIRDTLGMVVYDAGLDGVGVIGQYLAVKHAVNQGKLKAVVYDLGDLQLTSQWNQGKISTYYPYYWWDKDVRDIVDDCNPNAKYMLWSALYQYNSCYHDIIRTFVLKKSSDNGYEGLPYTGREWTPKYWKEKNIPFVPDSLAEAYLDRIVSICKEQHVQLVMTMAPGLGSGFKGTALYLDDYCKKHDLPFWNFTDLRELHNDSKLFKDYNHINEEGVKVFTPVVAHRLRLLLEENAVAYKVGI